MRFLFLVVGLTALAFVAMPAIWFGMHWLIIGLVIWGAMTLLRGPRPHYRRMYYGPARPIAPPPRREAPPQRAPERPAWQRLGSGLPLDVQVKVEQIRRKSEVLQRERHRFPMGSEDAYIIRATAEDYLPRTLDAFMAVSPASRDRAMPNGKTPLQELKEQLTLLDSKLDEIAEDLQRSNFDRLMINRQFLEARFGRKAPAEVI
ncbi:MAG TPA: hypothetical protein VK009_26545 [Chloroflexota bacterium]|nr:hypothetical protein [Chloroflexota bacterium]